MSGNFGAGDELTPAQAERLLRAVAVAMAKEQAYQAGASVAEVQSQSWLVDVQPLDTERL